MKFVRPLLEIEAMPIRDIDGTITRWCCDFGEGKQTQMLTAEELVERGFRMLNGHDPSKPLRRRKKRQKTDYSLAEKGTDSETPAVGLSAVTKFVVTGKDSDIEAGVEVEPAQEYDHQ